MSVEFKKSVVLPFAFSDGKQPPIAAAKDLGEVELAGREDTAVMSLL